MAKVDRPKRTSINGKRNILTVEGKDPAYEYRFVNDVDNRIQNFEQNGYEVVRDTSVKIGDKRIANPTAEGSPVMVSKGGTKSYLMRINKDWYEEDQASKQRIVDETEAAMQSEAKSPGMYGKVELSRS